VARHNFVMAMMVLATIVASLSPLLLLSGVLAFITELSYHLVLLLVGANVVAFLFSITFAAVRAPLKITNLFVTAASGSAGAWRFVSKLLGS